MQVTRRMLPPVARCAGVLLGLLLGGQGIVLAQGPAASERVIVSDVIISGNQQTSTEQIKVRLHTQAGKEFNPTVLDDDVRELYKTNQYSTIQTLKQDDGPGRVKIFFLLRDLPNTVSKVTFRGAKHIKEEELRNLTGVRPGQLLNPNLCRGGCRKIEDKYEEMGRPFAHCQLIKGGELGDTEVIYDITEGPKVKVCAIEFVGNTFVSSARLLTQVKSSSQWFGLIGGTYNKQMADNDVNELIKYFRAFGYMDVKVSLETQRSSDGSLVTLIFHIQEGQRYRIKEVPDVIGPKTIPPEQLQAQSQFKPGDPLEEAKIKGDLTRIQNWYGYNGQSVTVVPNFV